MLRAVSTRVGPGPVLLIGDRVDTDIAMGRAMGWATALVLTGVTSPDDAATIEVDHVLESVADLPGVVGLGQP
jgi:NagD protein